MSIRRMRPSTRRQSLSRRRTREFAAPDRLEIRALLASQVELVTDINQMPANTSPESITVVDDTIFFVDRRHHELWKSDGTPAGTTRLLEGRFQTFLLSGLSNFNGTLFFGVNGEDESALWKSDGTVEGTVPIRRFEIDITRTSYLPVLSQKAIVNGTLFFGAAADETDGIELWKSDGTEAGTVRVKDILPGTLNALDPQSFLTDVGGTLFFVASDGSSGRSVWKSDGTEAGTIPVSSFSERHGPRSLVNSDGTLYFTAGDEETGRELWKSDGTTTGTELVRDIHLGPIDSGARQLTYLNGKILFVADDGTGLALWSSDGTAERTRPVPGIPPFAGVRTIKDHRLYYIAGSPDRPELWMTDGTGDGTTLVYVFPQPTQFIQMLNVDGALRLFSRQGVWQSDGTALGTTQIATLSATGRGVSIHGNAYFSADNGVTGFELWKSDGTAEGTQIVQDLTPGTDDSGIRNIYNANGTLYFAADDGSSGSELWTSDGSADGTRFVHEITPGINGSFPKNWVTLGGRPYFFADSGLWTSDGTASGTRRIRTVSIRPSGELLVVNGGLFFSGNVEGAGNELWHSDGSTAGTRVVRNIYPGGYSSDPDNFTNVNGTFYFSADDGTVFGRTLWKSDGTRLGTTKIVDMAVGLYRDEAALANVNGTLFFAARNEESGFELWKLDAANQVAMQVKDIMPGAEGSDPRQLMNVDGTLYFAANDGESGLELWKSDGTADGTQRVTDIAAGAMSSLQDSSYFFPRGFHPHDGQLFFVANDGTHGDQVWVTDGTTAGTKQLGGNPSAQSGFRIREWATVQGTTYFTSRTRGNHYELWKTDGSPVSTARVQINSVGLSLAEFQGRLYFAGYTDDVGVELFVLKDEVSGDLDGDGAVNAADADLLFANWGNSGLGDVNQDGIVDAADAGVLFANWTVAEAVAPRKRPGFPRRLFDARMARA